MLKIAPFPQKTAQTHISYLKTVSNCPNEAPAPPSIHACRELYSAVQTLTNMTVPTAPNELDSADSPNKHDYAAQPAPYEALETGHITLPAAQLSSFI